MPHRVRAGVARHDSEPQTTGQPVDAQTVDGIMHTCDANNSAAAETTVETRLLLHLGLNLEEALDERLAN